MGFFILIGAVVLVIACLKAIAGAGSGAEALPALVILGVIVFGLGGSISNAVKDSNEGIRRVQSGRDIEKLARERIAIKHKYGNPTTKDHPNYEACEKEIKALNDSVVYGRREY